MSAFGVLMVHNHYRSANPSGENRSFADERALLEEYGHEVVTYERDSDEIARMDVRDRALVGGRVVWNNRARRELAEIIARTRPAVAHFQNTFPLISPAAYRACRDAGVPVIQAVRNYRLLCVNGYLHRPDGPCGRCVGHAPWRGVVDACYRDSRIASASVAAMITTHRALGTWRDAVDVYVAPSRFVRDKLIAGGLEPARIVVKPNFVAPDPGPGHHRGDAILFVGRLGPEKGLATLLRAAEALHGRVPLRIVGDGELAPLVRDAAERGLCEWLGARPPAEVRELMGDARAVVVPSEWYEPFGRVVVEAYARGTPVVATAIGGLPEIVDDGRTGLLARPHDAADLARALDEMHADERRARAMGEEARRTYEERYTAAANYRILREIYDDVLTRAA